MRDECSIAADLLEEHGLEVAADVLRSPWSKSLGNRISIYGPNYIWRGKLIGIHNDSVTLEDCYQVYETGGHDSEESEGELIGTQTFMTAAICNWGECKWS